MGKLEKEVSAVLRNANEGLTLAEIAEKVGAPEKKVFKELRRFFEKGQLTSENRRYKLVDE